MTEGVPGVRTRSEAERNASPWSMGGCRRQPTIEGKGLRNTETLHEMQGESREEATA
jgi:hypothetical protein